MADAALPSTRWTKTEKWVWDRIAAGEAADLNARDREQRPEFKDLDPCKEEGWSEDRRLHATFLQTILTSKPFVDATPYGGVRILGALVDDAPLNLEYARVQRVFWLERSRILTDVKCRNFRIDGEISLGESFVAGSVELHEADIKESLFTAGGTFQRQVLLTRASIGHALEMNGSTFEEKADLNGIKVSGSAFLRDDATFKGELDLTGASIGSSLYMNGSTFEARVYLDAAKVGGWASLGNGAIFKAELDLTSASVGSTLDMTRSTFRGKVKLNGIEVSGPAILGNRAIFERELDLTGASIGSHLDMSGSTFERMISLTAIKVGGAAFLHNHAIFRGKLALVSASIGSHLDMSDSIFEGELDLTSAIIGSHLNMSSSTFEKKVNLDAVKVSGSAFLRNGATFKDELNFNNASIGSALDLSAANISGRVDMSGCRVTGVLRLGSSSHAPAHWEKAAELALRNAHVGALQDWWGDKSDNSWPLKLELEGFSYDQLGGLFGAAEEANMMARPSKCYVEWLRRNPSLSPQPYEQLANVFRRAGDPVKSNDILFAARERRRGSARWRAWFGLSLLRWTIGYGLGNGYFLALLWVLGFTLLGTAVLLIFGTHHLEGCLKSPESWLNSPESWPKLFLTSFDQLLPIVTLNKAHETLILGDPSANPAICPQRYGVVVYFYVHKIVGWVLASFIVAGLAGLTQRN